MPCVILQKCWRPWQDVFTILLARHLFGHGKDRLLTDVCTLWVLLIIHMPSKHSIAQVFLKIHQTMSSACVSLFRTQEVIGILLPYLCLILCINCRKRTSNCIKQLVFCYLTGALPLAGISCWTIDIRNIANRCHLIIPHNLSTGFVSWNVSKYS